MTERENKLRAIRFEKPEYIPMTFVINPSCWEMYPHEALFELMETHPLLFPGFVRPNQPFNPYIPLTARKDSPYVDDFGCIWTTTMDGITGSVTKHPIADWEDYKNYCFPNPEKCMGLGEIDWEKEKTVILEAKAMGKFTQGGLRHGHTFLQLCDIRGYENLMFDFADTKKEIFELIERLEQFNAFIVNKYLNFGVDMMSYAEDLGMQSGPMISPNHLKKYIKPSYQRLMKPARDKGCIVHMHSDGDIRKLVDDLIDDGVEVINLQDLVNGIDWIAHKFAGRICVELDINRQSMTGIDMPSDIEALIYEEVTQLGSKQGGLMMIYGLYPGVPLANIKALMDAMEKYAGWFS